MKETINLTEWKTKKQICNLFQISISLYKIRLNELKSSLEYSGCTKTLKIDSKPNSNKKTTKRFIHESVLDKFFSRRRVRLNDTDKTKKWSLNQKWDYFCHIVPEAIHERELKEKVKFFGKKLQELGKSCKMFFCIEDNPNDREKGWVHTHILIKNPKLSINTLNNLIKETLTHDEERRILVERYDSEHFGTRGIEYLHKDQYQRFFRIHRELTNKKYL
jgi:hypothetical protein